MHSSSSDDEFAPLVTQQRQESQEQQSEEQVHVVESMMITAHERMSETVCVCLVYVRLNLQS